MSRPPGFGFARVFASIGVQASISRNEGTNNPRGIRLLENSRDFGNLGLFGWN